jgi:predicted nucleotidyltransferase
MHGEKLERLKKRIIELEQPEKIILFGSRARGTATEDSDFDLLVISRSTLPRYQREVRLTRRLFGSGVAFDLLVLTPEEFGQRVEANGPFLREILSCGEVLYERSAA